MKRLMIAVALAASTTGCMMFTRAPSDPAAYARTQTSAANLYRATFTPAEHIRMGKLHSWNLEVVTADGVPVDDCKITVDGGMPQHGHGLPTKPIVSQHLGDGKHVVEGMRFNMGGWWVVKFRIQGSKGADEVTFNIKL
ncbi:MAG: FixH family protein [Gemmatimonadota bacterium]